MTTPVSLYELVFSNGKRYIGISQNPARRFAAHRQAANRGSKYAVHAAIRKHGVPEMRILCIGSREYIGALEIKAMAAFHTRERAYGYNQSVGGETSPVATIGHTEESRAKMKVSQRERAAREGGRVEHMTRIAQIAAAQRSSDEYRAVARESAKQRWQENPMTTDERERMRRMALGNTHCVGRFVSPETRAKISASLKGRRPSDDVRAKQSQAQRARWQKRSTD